MYICCFSFVLSMVQSILSISFLFCFLCIFKVNLKTYDLIESVSPKYPNIIRFSLLRLNIKTKLTGLFFNTIYLYINVVCALISIYEKNKVYKKKTLPVVSSYLHIKKYFLFISAQLI